MYSYIITLHSTAIFEQIRNEPDYSSRQKLMESEVRNITQEIGLKGTIERVYGGVFFGFVIRNSEEEIKLLSEDARVKYIEEDQAITLSPPKFER